MKKDGKYRFNLQFPAETEEQIQVGEFLEQLGNQKSAVVVAALGEYMAARPGLLQPGYKLEVKTTRMIQSGQLEQLVKMLVDERLNSVQTPAEVKANSPSAEPNVSEMLDNLDIFQ